MDALALVILSMFFLPAAQSRWGLSRRDGAGLIIGYLGYLLLTLFTQIDVGTFFDFFKLLIHAGPPHPG